MNYDVSQLIETQDKLRALTTQVTEDFANLTRLHKLSLLLLRTDTAFQENLDAALSAAMDVCGAPKGNIQLLETSSKTLKLAAQSGFDAPFLGFFEFVRDDGSACAAAMRSGERVLVEDVESSDLFGEQSRQVMLDAEARSVVSLPLISSAGTLLGMLSVHFREQHRPSEAELTRLELVARQAAEYLERKRNEETASTLRRELEHRSNNMLQMIQGLVRQTLSTSSTLEDASETLSSRLLTLARTNRLLAEAGWQKIDLAEIAAPEFSMFPGRVDIQGDKIDLDPQIGQRFAFLIHELVTNAVKHGALSGSTGSVAVFWNRTRAHAGPVLSFRWEERQGPPVSAPKRQGFGSQLVATIFPDGRTEYAPQGFKYVLDLPMG